MEMRAFERLMKQVKDCNTCSISDVKMASLHEATDDIRPDHSQEQETFKGQAADMAPNGFKNIDCKIVILCSASYEEHAKIYLRNNSGSACIVCKDKSVFTKDRTPVNSSLTLFLIVDAEMHDVLVTKKGLHKSINKYFKYVDHEKAKVRVVDKCAENKRMFHEVFFQLPSQCRNEVEEILVTATRDPEESDPAADESSTSESDEDDGDELDDGEIEDEEEISIDDVTSDPDTVTEDVNSNEEGSDTFVMVGKHETMEAVLSSEKTVYLTQMGQKNTMKLTIPVIESTNPDQPGTVLVLIKTGDLDIDKELFEHISLTKDSINYMLKSNNIKAKVVSVTRGSVVIEMEVEPGQEMTTDWINSVLDTVLSESMSTIVPEGATLTLDVTSNQVVPLKSLTSTQQQQAMDLLRVRETTPEIGPTSSAQGQSPVPVHELEDMLLSVLKFGVSGSVDPTDIQISFLDALSHIQDTDPWQIAIQCPHLFLADGPFYNVVKEDIGVEQDKFFRLPTFPDKEFRFNEKNGKIELCVAPQVYYEIGPDIDERVDKATLFRQIRKKATDKTHSKRKTSKPFKAALGEFTELGESESNEEYDGLSELTSFTGNQSGKTKDSTDSGFSDGTSESKSKKGDSSTTVSASE